MVIVVGVVVIKDGKILLVQEAQEKCRGQWNFPSGHLDEGEHIVDAVVREAKEETGYDIKPISLLQVFSTDNGQPQFMFFEGEVVGGEIKFDPAEVLDVKWIPIEEIPNTNTRLPKEVFGRLVSRIENKNTFPLDAVEKL
jgi:ADP-ribose pyrophosphatase YjhB (NUDIX family)